MILRARLRGNPRNRNFHGSRLSRLKRRIQRAYICLALEQHRGVLLHVDGDPHARLHSPESRAARVDALRRLVDAMPAAARLRLLDVKDEGGVVKLVYCTGRLEGVA